jgi:type IV pilus assembly protein PilY1
MRTRRLLPTVAALAALGAGTAHAQSIPLDPERILLPFDQDLEALIVDDRTGDGASHTMGWFYYDELISRGYVNVQDPGNPNDDTLVDSDGNAVPDFHEDLFNLNPNRPYVGIAPRCSNRFFVHPTPSGQVVPFREPDLLTGDCNHPSTYSPTGGPRRWPDGDPLFPPRPGGGVVGRGVEWYDLAWPYMNQTLTISRDSGFFKTDHWFSDRGLFPHIPNLLEPKDPLNGNRGIGNLVMLSLDDDNNTCGNSPSAECLQPRLAWSTDGTTQVGPVWDRSWAGNDGLPDYKASAFDPQGRLIPGKDPAAPITEEDRRVKLGRVRGNREMVFFLIANVQQIYGRSGEESTDSCFMTATVNGRAQCTLWAHGDLNVFFSKTLLNMDVFQQLGSEVATKELRSGWLSPTAYQRLSTSAYGGVVFNYTQVQTVRSYNQRTPHALIAAPANNGNVWIVGWEDQNAGGNRTFNDSVILINKLPPSP